MQRELAREAKGWVREAERKEAGLGKKDYATWNAVLDERSCPSCEDRHGEEKQMRTWEAAGLPGSDNLVCGSELPMRIDPIRLARGRGRLGP